MKYWKNKIAIGTSDFLPSDAVEITTEPYESELAYIREHTIHIDTEVVEEDDYIDDTTALSEIMGVLYDEG